jgi:uncharacterized membrane protein
MPPLSPINLLHTAQVLSENFNLTGNFNLRAERIGRMNPAKMVEAVARNLYEKVLARC